jgi:hypothetical protein
MLADNKLNDRSSWDKAALARRLKELSELALDFEITAIGFERPNIDLRIRSLDATPKDDYFEGAAGPAVSKVGDLWFMDSHRLHCADVLDAGAYDIVLDGEKAVAAFADRRFDPAVDDHAPGEREVTEEFSTPPRQMSAVEPTSDLKRILVHLGANCHEGAFLYFFSDWRHMGEILASANDVGLSLVDLCAGPKTTAERVQWARPTVLNTKSSSFSKMDTRPARTMSAEVAPAVFAQTSGIIRPSIAVGGGRAARVSISLRTRSRSCSSQTRS